MDKSISELLPHLADSHINERIYTLKHGSLLPELVKKLLANVSKLISYQALLTTHFY